MASKPEKSQNGQPVLADYANYFEVGHNSFEFLLDFGQIDPSSGAFHVATRIAIGPTHAKLLSRLLESAVSQYESSYEPIAEIRNDELLDSALDTSPEFERRALAARRSKSRTSKRK